MKILRNKDGLRAINQKCNGFTADIITYGALTIESMCEEYNVTPKINKTTFLEDIICSEYHKTHLEYGVLGKKIDVKEACDVACAARYFVTFETFYFEFGVNNEIESIKKFFSNKESIKEMYYKGMDDKYQEVYEVSKYQVDALIGLEQSLEFIKENAINNGEKINSDEIGFYDEYEEIILEYYSDLVIEKINTAEYYRKNPMQNEYLDIVRNFLNKDYRTFKRLIKNLIRHIYIKKEIRQEKGYYSDINFNRLQQVILEHIIEYMDI